MSIYYNPQVRKDLPCKLLRDCYVIKKDSVFYSLKSKRAYSSREEALAQTFEGYIQFFENNELYEGYLIQDWTYKAVTNSVADSGINWNTYYAVTPELLKELVSKNYTEVEDYEPQLNDYGLYHVQVHYSGRTR